MPPTKPTELEDSLAMPPPPNPPQPAILQPEINALARCLKNTVVQTGLIYEFHAKAHKYAPRHTQPPRSMTTSLGRELEKYDQLCDSLEAHLLRAISVLQCDLTREKERIENEKTAQIMAQKDMETISPVEQADFHAPSSTSQLLKGDATIVNIQSSPHASTSVVGRRPSAISISSLHRPAFLHKLDLSSTSFRISAEESAMFQSGLASPVTLAPKSARAMGPNEFPPELIAAFTNASDAITRPPDIDLTLPDVMQESRETTDQAVDLTAGDSSDKPIELDLDIDIDMTDLFGDPTDDPDVTVSQDVNQNSNDLFSPVLVAEEAGGDKSSGFFNNVEATDGKMFTALESNVNEGQPIETRHSPKNPYSQQTGASPASPGALFANFPSPANQGGDITNTSLEAEQSFDFNSLDLTNMSPGFFSGAQGSDMGFSMDFSMGESEESKEGIGPSSSV